jgi:hypothetical protein
MMQDLIREFDPNGDGWYDSSCAMLELPVEEVPGDEGRPEA